MYGRAEREGCANFSWRGWWEGMSAYHEASSASDPLPSVSTDPFSSREPRERCEDDKVRLLIAGCLGRRSVVTHSRKYTRLLSVFHRRPHRDRTQTEEQCDRR